MATGSGVPPTAATGPSVGVSPREQALLAAAQAASDLSEIASAANSANSTLQSSIGLKFYGIFPFLGTQIRGAKSLVSDVARFSDGAVSMVVAADNVAKSSSGTYVDLHKLDELRKQVGINSIFYRSFTRSPDSLIGPVANARRKFNAINRTVVQLLQKGAGGLDYAERFLGLFGSKNYLLAGENQAEMRDGGAVLSWAILSTHNGHFDVNLAQSVGKLQLSRPAPFRLPVGTARVFGPLLPTQVWQSTNATGDFALSGQIMSSMFTAATGRHVDGVIGMDVSVLQSLLRLTGPVHIGAYRGPVGSGNVVDVLLHRFYLDNRGNSQDLRHDEIAAVAEAAVKKMNSTHVDVARLIRALSTTSQARHLTLWDASPARQGLVVSFDGSGELATTHPESTFHVSVQSGVAAKLDYYTRTTEAMTVNIDASGNAFVTTKVTVHNNAPAGHRPSYQLGPDHVNSFHPGDYVARVYQWSPRGSVVPGGVSESGLVLDGPVPAFVKPQQSATVTFQTVILNAVKHHGFMLRLIPQATLHPATVTIAINAPQWNPSITSTSVVLDKTRTVSLTL
ncbi:MAG: DUF4012 domain-containing protein [Actinomycetota bacterium]